MTMTIFNFALLVPGDTAKAKDINDEIFASGHVLGIEVTNKKLAPQCLIGNIDPQHLVFHAETFDVGGGYYEPSHNTCITGEAAIEFASRLQPMPKHGWIPTMFPPSGATLVTIRADVDSIGSMAVLHLRAKGITLHQEAMDRIVMVATADKFTHGGWPGPRPLPTRSNPWDESLATAEASRPLAAIAAAISDFRVPMADRVATMEKWLLTGEEPKQYRDSVEEERLTMITALETGLIKHETRSNGRIAVVESAHRAATSVGYAFAPVVVARNPAFRLGGGEPHVKFTICQFTGGFVNFESVLAELNELEPGWGGSPTIGGSPQGVSSSLTTDQVVEVVEKFLLR